MGDAQPRRRRRGVAATVLAGVASAALAAVASHQDWARADVPGGAGAAGSDVAPAALALALVALAAWGAVLVLRGTARQVAAAVGAAAALGVATVVATSGDEARAAALQAQSTALAGPAEGASLTAWFLVAAGAAAVCAGCLVVAVVTAGRWPEMSRRYDAPAARGPGTTTSQDAWRALDEGRDPTA